MQPKNKYKVARRGYKFNKGSTFKRRGFCLQMWSVAWKRTSKLFVIQFSRINLLFCFCIFLLLLLKVLNKKIP